MLYYSGFVLYDEDILKRKKKRDREATGKQSEGDRKAKREGCMHIRKIRSGEDNIGGAKGIVQHAVFRRRSCFFLLFVIAVFLCTSCGKKRYQDQFTDVFDTASMVIGYEGKEADFQRRSKLLHDTLLHYHELFDVYTAYPGVENLKKINEEAGKAPVKVDKEIMALLRFGKEIYQDTDGRVNIAYGAVLALWHEKREEGIASPQQASLPDDEALVEAAKHCNIEDLVLDEEHSTVYFKDPKLRLDVGGIAKGWSVERAAEILEKDGAKQYLLNIGGNLRAIGKKADGKRWICPVQNPFYVDGEDSEPYAVTGEIENTSLVTSGDYERYYMVDGVRYAHIVDPETRYPANRHRSVTILTKDSGLADGLSTALFILSVEDGKALLQKIKKKNAVDIEAMWVEQNHEKEYTAHFLQAVRAEDPE